MTIHLIRHGEVHNPLGFVYADIAGFSLSEKGRLQAKAAGEYLSGEPPRLIVTSPLDRAVETATIIAAATGADVTADGRLSEWGLGVRWRGALWAELPKAFPGELEAKRGDVVGAVDLDGRLGRIDLHPHAHLEASALEVLVFEPLFDLGLVG